MDEMISYSIKTIVAGEFGVSKTSFVKKFAYTSGLEKYIAISSLYYRGAKAKMLFYDITNLNSFNSLERWLDDIHKYAEPRIIQKMIEKFTLKFKTDRIFNSENKIKA